jgi:shikimate dehydrogenase
MSTATISGQSRPAQKELLVGLIGTGIRASRSPALHMDEARALGLPLRYVVIDLDDRPGGATALPQVLQEAEAAGFVGLNVTHPCKQHIIEYLHDLSADARALGAVNTVVFSGGRRVGHNTDWWGFGEGFRRGLPGAVIDVVTQLGAGGAGSATAYAMLQMGTRHLQVFDIDQEKAERLAATLRDEFSPHQIEVIADLESALRDSDGLINTSPVGMDKYPGPADTRLPAAPVPVGGGSGLFPARDRTAARSAGAAVPYGGRWRDGGIPGSRSISTLYRHPARCAANAGAIQGRHTGLNSQRPALH